MAGCFKNYYFKFLFEKCKTKWTVIVTPAEAVKGWESKHLRSHWLSGSRLKSLAQWTFCQQ